MVTRAIFLIALIFAPLATWGDSQVPERPPQVLQDSKTKVIYYLESDRRHVSAIGPEGKLLWCCEVIRAPQNDFQRETFFISSIGWDSDGVSVSVFAGKGRGKINRATGAYTPPEMVL